MSLETRHLIFLLPFAAMAIAAGILRLGSADGWVGPGIVAALVGFLVASQIAWGLERTRWLYTGEPSERAEARAEAASWLAGRARPDDVLFGYEPTYLDAWEEGAQYGEIFVPRADAKLALDTLEEAGEPLGHGVWVLDASDYLDQDDPPLHHPERLPREPSSRPLRSGRSCSSGRGSRPARRRASSKRLSRCRTSPPSWASATPAATR